MEKIKKRFETLNLELHTNSKSFNSKHINEFFASLKRDLDRCEKAIENELLVYENNIALEKKSSGFNSRYLRQGIEELVLSFNNVVDKQEAALNLWFDDEFRPSKVPKITLGLADLKKEPHVEVAKHV